MKKILITIGTLIFFLWTLFLISFGGCIFRSSHICYLSYVHTFNSDTWKNAYDKVISKHYLIDLNDSDKRLQNTRKPFAMNLIREKKLIGKTKQEVIDILGIENNPTQENSWKYWVDFGSIDNLWLSIDFENDRVIKNSFYED